MNGATEAISKISLDDIKTENHLGIVEVTARGVSAYPKDYLTFKDFMGTSLSDAITTTNPDYCVSDYAEMFAKQYEKYKEENPEEQYELNEYLKELYTQGKFDHDVDKPFLSFLDEALLITIIVPIIEACTGEELLTGNKLTDLERGLRAVCAVVDIVSLGATATTSKMTISSIGKLMLAETGSNLVATTTGYIGSELGLPMPLVLALSTMGGSIAGIQLANTHFCKGPISGSGRVDDFLEVKHLEASGGPEFWDEYRKIEGGLGTLSTPSSKVLRQNLIDAGVEVPDYPNAAHHMVAGSSPKAAEARAILQKYGVDINDAANGTFLPTVKDVAEGAYHPSLHTNAYYDKINKLLSEATCKEDVLDILEFIGDELSGGAFML